MKNFIKEAIKNGDVKRYSEVYDSDPNLLEEGERLFYIGEKTVKYPRYEIGDIIYVKNYKYENGSDGNNHLFVIVDDDNYGVPIDYFCMIISSNLDKLKYKSNKLLRKNDVNKLNKNSIVKTDTIYDIKYDEISFSVGKVSMKLVDEYIKLYLENKDVIYE